ncbi:MAG: 16S rRNA (adenine(1518)-N(6)/adenine(1519)-N(6))-dimethyltransferase RsmA [Eubacteriales bacterium]|jgi:16S rRNA (adenine1518-N6/adenine1519-N6)-dimethyltransferase|nr:16S rRNA (adenine(1518)-N(6)/adenine(1519)-N(6))-dimethyltransferase RsmA [Eubacteriales bacterium]
MKLTSPENVKKIMSKGGFRFKKSLGQNFLIDEDVLAKTIEASEVTKEIGVIEIGPGIGTLTQALSEKAGKVVAIELDREIAAYLKKAFVAYGNVEIIQGDALKMDLEEVIEQHFANMPTVVVANLPYYITTPLIMKFLEDTPKIDSVTVMIQKEVADRMVAKPSTSEYGALSVAVQYYSTPKIITTVSPQSFMPPPKVTSAVIRLDIKNHTRPFVKNEKKFFKVVKAAFSQKRKTLANSLSSQYSVPKEQLKSLIYEVCGSDNVRAEDLGIKEFVKISENLQ